MEVEPGSTVKIAFTATYPDGELFDTSSPEVATDHDVEADKRFRPIVLEVGAEPAIASLQEGLIGLTEGDTKRIELPHEDLQITYDRADFEAMIGERPVEGREIHAKTGLLGEVVALDEETVTVDFDPERAGETLTFDVEILEIEYPRDTHRRDIPRTRPICGPVPAGIRPHPTACGLGELTPSRS